MEKILFVMAIAFTLMAVSSRHKMHKNMDEEQSSENVNQSLTGSENDPKSLTYALTKMTSGPQMKFAPAVPNAPPPSAPQAKSASMSKEEMVQQVNKFVQEIQVNNEESPYSFEKGLALTSSANDLALKLTILQAAMSIQGDSLLVRNMAMREATSLLVQENLGTDAPTPEQVAKRDLERNIVTTAFKVYIQSSQDADLTFNDTLQILNYQTDPWIRRQLIFEAVSRYPQLREKLNE